MPISDWVQLCKTVVLAGCGGEAIEACHHVVVVMPSPRLLHSIQVSSPWREVAGAGSAVELTTEELVQWISEV